VQGRPITSEIQPVLAAFDIIFITPGLHILPEYVTLANGSVIHIGCMDLNTYMHHFFIQLMSERAENPISVFISGELRVHVLPSKKSRYPIDMQKASTLLVKLGLRLNMVA
jgi:hypothetical protein